MKQVYRVGLVALVLLLTAAGAAEQNITAPREQFGFNLGDDYHLANYRQLTEYWRKLEQESDRLALREIGTSVEGRSILMAIITSPENHARLDRYREIAQRLAWAENLSEEEARALANEGKAVVWIDGGLHATEVLGAQQLMELVYQMVSGQDEETLRILRDVILLAVCVNPDGLDLVADWYMRNPEPEKRSLRGLPRLYHHYIGHDNNRDFYMVTQPESQAINRVLYREWFPQIAYNHHQTGPSGTVLFAPPFRDPFNYNLDPLIPASLELVGGAMHARFVSEGKPGATMRSGASYSTWWNGGLRTTQYFHNIIGLLTETIGSPNPIEIPFILRRQLPHNDLPFPIQPQKWHFRQSVDYSITANRAVLDLASRYREQLLLNIYRMGRNSIERGSRDHWTVDPSTLARVEAAYRKDNPEATRIESREIPEEYLQKTLLDPELRDPRGYVLTSAQADFNTAGKFVNTLIANGVRVHRAVQSFQVGEKTYPAGSYVVKTAQAFRPHILDMFEPQHHPDDFPYPGGPPVAPYDSAGWTLAYQMGVEFDRILEPFDGPFGIVQDLVEPGPGSLELSEAVDGYLLSHRVNDAFRALNRLLRDGEQVYWLDGSNAESEGPIAPGTMLVRRREGTEERLRELATELGLDFSAVAEFSEGAARRVEPVRIGLWDRYGGSMDSGWIRWLLEQYEFAFEVVFPPELNQGDLRERFDVLILPGGAVPQLEEDERRQRFRRRYAPDPDELPEELRAKLGDVTVEKTVPRLREFLEAGGIVLAIGSSTALAYHLELPIENHLVERTPRGEVKQLSREKYYVPGSVLRTRVDPSHPLAYGMPPLVDVYFNNSPTFRLPPQAHKAGVRAVAWFEGPNPIRSGWAWGQSYLQDGVAVLEAPVGKGRLVLFGPEIVFRGQPHGTFKLLFNGLFLGGLQDR